MARRSGRQTSKHGEWTATGAARRARDLRAQTVELLGGELTGQREGRHSFNARRVADELYPHFLTFRRSGYGVNTALAMLHSGLGYPPRYLIQAPSGGTSYADEVAENLGTLATRLLTDDVSLLAQSELYAISPELCDVVTASAASLTDDDCALIEADDLPSPTGLIVLPHTVRSVGSAGPGGTSDFRGTHRSRTVRECRATGCDSRPMSMWSDCGDNSSANPPTLDSAARWSGKLDGS